MLARILVVENNKANLELMTCLLQAAGHAVLQARSGEGVLAIVRREMPDLILCDLHMPKVDGFEVERQLKQDLCLCQIPIVAVTASLIIGDRQKVISVGFDGYIDKPISPENFVNQVERFLSRGQVPCPCG